MKKVEERARVKESKQGIPFTCVCVPAPVFGSSLRYTSVPIHACANALTHSHAHTYTEERAKKRERILKGFEVFEGETEERHVRREVRRESPGESGQELQRIVCLS